MTREVAIGAVRLSTELPRIVAAGGQAALDALVAADGADLVELRADLFDDPRPTAVVAALERLRAAGRPIVLTVRAAEEGGGRLAEGARRELYLAGLAHADAIDVEIASTALASELVPRARAAGRTVILSAHAMDGTPPADALLPLVDRAEAMGADVTKLAATARDLEDVRTMLAVTLAARHRGIVTVAMGPAGALGRLRHAALPRLELLEEEPAREKAVEGLGALALAADSEAGRKVPQHDAGRHLVDVLPATPTRADEMLLEVLLAHAEPAHGLFERARFLRRDREHYGFSRPGTPAPRRPCPAANRIAPARPTANVAPPRRRSSASASSSGSPKPRIAASRS